MALAAGGSQSSGAAGASSSKDNGKDSSKGSTATAYEISFVLDYTPNTNHTGIYVAVDLGYFAEEGLSVDIIQPPDGGADALIGSGKAQLGVSYQDTMANNLASSQPLPYTAVAAVIQHNTSGIMSRKEDGITHAAAMEGHSYGTWNLPVEQATIRQIMEADGGDFSKLELVPYEVDDDVSGLRAKMFDTVWVYEGWSVKGAEVQGLAYNYFSFISMDDVFDFYTPVLAANDSFIKEHPNELRAFLRAAKKGYVYAAEHPKEAAEILCKAVPELDPELVEKSQEFLSAHYIDDAPSWGVIDKDRWARYYQWLNDEGLVEKKLDVNAGYDTSYLPEA